MAAVFATAATVRKVRWKMEPSKATNKLATNIFRANHRVLACVCNNHRGGVRGEYLAFRSFNFALPAGVNS